MLEKRNGATDGRPRGRRLPPDKESSQCGMPHAWGQRDLALVVEKILEIQLAVLAEKLAPRARKPHPTVGDNVTIYANATVLGGDTKIGDNSVIGGSVFLTGSVTPTCVVNIESPRLRMRTRNLSGISVDH